jgi:hypothetical protein
MITGRFFNGNIRVTDDGQVRLAAEVALVDDVLGPLASRNLSPTDPAVEAQVRAFIEASLPALSAFAGYEVTMPKPAPAPLSVDSPAAEPS